LLLSRMMMMMMADTRWVPIIIITIIMDGKYFWFN
jgi:hypothetical protein